jgi:hypothetical protein
MDVLHVSPSSPTEKVPMSSRSVVHVASTRNSSYLPVSIPRNCALTWIGPPLSSTHTFPFACLVLGQRGRAEAAGAIDDLEMHLLLARPAVRKSDRDSERERGERHNEDSDRALPERESAHLETSPYLDDRRKAADPFDVG